MAYIAQEAIEVTYTQLVELITNSKLIPNAQYLIADYRTIHYIVDGEDIKHGINIGELEPLVVTAISINKLDKEAKSTTYPQDIIYYDWNPENWLADLAFADAEAILYPNPSVWPGNQGRTIIPNFKGVIYFRHDTLLDNSLGYDFRNVKFRRWKMESVTYNASTTYNPGDLINYGSFICKAIAITTGNAPTVDPWTAKDNYWEYVCPLTSQYMKYKAEGSTDYQDFKTFAEVCGITYEQAVMSNHFATFKDDAVREYGTASILPNNVFFIRDFGWSGNTTITGNTFGAIFNNCTFAGWVMSNDIGAYFEHNTVFDMFAYNKIDESFMYNTVGAIFQNNHISSDFYGNTIGAGFKDNYTGPGFWENTIGAGSYNNTVGAVFTNNIISHSFKINVIGSSFTNNTIGNTFQYNNISSAFRNNTVGNNFQYNRIGSYMRYNTITNNFQRNDVQASEGTSGTPINYTSATHVYAVYNCTIYKRPDGALKLRYFDNSDVQQIVNATA